MAQTFTDNCFIASGSAQTDMQNIETNFAALKSSFSGTAAPSNTVGGMPWHDSTARKIRNYANTGWLVSLLGDSSQKMWVYRNDVAAGWLLDASVTDRVLSIKGGSNAYNVNGGLTAGTWTQTGHTHTGPSHVHTGPSHNHQWYDFKNGENDESYQSNGSAIDISVIAKAAGDTSIVTGTADNGPGSDLYTDNDGTGNTGAAGTGNTGSSATAATYRPAAAVGTLQYPDTT